MINIISVIIALGVAGILIFSPRLSRSTDWKATVTPLASIMGSGFLVSAPLLAGIVGNLALFGIIALLIVAWFVGGVIRFNIRYFEPIENARHGPVQNLAFMSRIVLSGAYFISVSYYLQLLAAFSLRIFHIDDPLFANMIATAILVLIGIIGVLRGLAELEQVEKFAVSLNLGVIAALLVSLLIYNVQLVLSGSWALAELNTVIDFQDLRVLLGLLIVVQGFETSRYLGDDHPADQRIRTMKRAQGISALIYVVFIALASVLFQSGLGSDATAIITMTAPLGAVLPLLLTFGAIGSQFSAAVADNAGAGGLLRDLSRHGLSARSAYLLIMLITVALTWATNVNQIIAYASRAFALFYTLQCVVAAMVAWQQQNESGRLLRVAGFLLLGLICVAVFVLGLPSE